MLMCEVVGSIVCTTKHDSLVGNKLLIVETLDIMGDQRRRLIAIDTVGAGNGEIVLVTTGSSARKSIDNYDTPIDAAIVGIVDGENNISINQ